MNSDQLFQFILLGSTLSSRSLCPQHNKCDQKNMKILMTWAYRGYVFLFEIFSIVSFKITCKFDRFLVLDTIQIPLSILLRSMNSDLLFRCFLLGSTLSPRSLCPQHDKREIYESLVTWAHHGYVSLFGIIRCFYLKYLFAHWVCSPTHYSWTV